MKSRISRLPVLAMLALMILAATAPSALAAAGLAYDEHTRGPMPIPPSERNLQTVTAAAWLTVADKNDILEGAIFDARGNLLFCDVSNGRVLRATPDKKLSAFVDLDGYSPGGIAFHKDGRLFIAALDSTYTKGAIFAVNPDGKGLRAIISTDAGYLPNDLVMDAHGGFYFTDFKGSPTQPKGGVYYVSPDFKTVTCVVPNLAMANGVALSPDGGYLWITEFGRNLLHRVELADATTMGPIGTAIPYRFAGPAPDSMRVDADGNVYVAVHGQGRVLVFNPNGIPIGQVLLPGREQGHNLRTTSLAISPDSNDMYVVTSDHAAERGSAIFHAKVFAKGLKPLNMQ